MRVIHLPAGQTGDLLRTEIAFGYTVGTRNQPGYPDGVSDLARFFLEASVPARSVALATHLGNGEFEFVNEADRIGMRLGVPSVLTESVLISIAAYFERPLIDPETFEYVRRRLRLQAGREPEDFQRGVREEIGSILLGDYPHLWSRPANVTQIDQIQPGDLETYFQENFGTDRAYVILSERAPEGSLERLEGIEARRSTHNPVTGLLPDAAETSLSFPARDEGGVVLSTAVPSVHFDAWFHALVVDGMLRQIVPSDAKFEFLPAVDPGMHSIEIPVRIPLFAEDVRNRLVEAIAELQVRDPDPVQLRGAVASTLGLLEQRSVREWFAAHDLWSVLETGWQVVDGMRPDVFRAAARDFAALPRVMASWAPAFQQPRVTVERLGAAAETPREEPLLPLGRAPGRVEVPPIDAVPFPQPAPIRIERLESGISIGEDSGYGVFVAGQFDTPLPGVEARVGPNGSYWSLPFVPNAVLFEPLRNVRPDRILFLAPRSGLLTLRERLSGWVGGTMDSTASLAVGPVASGDLPALLVLKTWLDAKLIEAGWWGQVELRIDATEGARLIIEAPRAQEVQILAWIAAVADAGLEEGEFLRIRSATIVQYERIRRDLQILLWQKDPQGVLPLPDAVRQTRLRDVARIYF